MTAYLLCATVCTPLYGKLSDIYGRRVTFQAAILIFLVGSVLAGLAPGMLALVLSRGVQGVGAGGVMGLTFAVVGDIVSPRQRGRYIGYLAGVWAFASVIGPLLGGFIVDHTTWRWVFLINLPIGGAALAVIWVVLRLPPVHRPARIDFAGAALLMAGVSLLLLALVQVQERGAEALDATAVGLTAGRRGADRGVHPLGSARRASVAAAPALPQPHLRDRVGAGAAHRLCAVRCRDLPAALSAGRRRPVGHQLRSAAAPAYGRRARRLGRVGPADVPHRPL